MRRYQYDFSKIDSSMYDKPGRERKARTMIAVLQEHISQSPLDELRLLDIGASTGIVDNQLARHFGSVVGVDIDEAAITHAQHTYARSNLEFRVGDALQLQFGDRHFDVVVCSQVYEHVPDPKRMMDEIFRVLVPGGVCYFAAGNRLQLTDPEYHLPLLSVVPYPLSRIYARLAGKGDYHEIFYSYWELKRLVRRFVLHDYTWKMLADPHKYSITYMVPSGSIKAFVARLIGRHIRWLSPGFVWLLDKPKTESDIGGVSTPPGGTDHGANPGPTQEGGFLCSLSTA